MAGPGDVQIGRISRYFSKWLGSKGFSPRLTFGSEITPVLPLWSGAENRFLDSWNRFGSALTAAAGGAGNRSACRIANPAGSKIIAVIEKLTIVTLAADQPVACSQINTGIGAFATVTPASFDTRGQPQPVCSVGGNTNVGAIAAGAFYQGSIGAAGGGILDLISDDNQEITVDDGSAVTVFANVLNQQIIVNVWWRERALEDSEQK